MEMFRSNFFLKKLKCRIKRSRNQSIQLELSLSYLILNVPGTSKLIAATKPRQL